MDSSSEASSLRRSSARRGGNRLALFAIEPRSYAHAIGGAVAKMRPDLEVLVVEPDELDAEVESRNPCLVFSSRPGPEGATVRWAQFRPYEDPDTVRVDGHSHRFPGLELEDLLGLVDRFCGIAAATG